MSTALAFLQSPLGASLVLIAAAGAWKLLSPLFDKGEATADTAIEKNTFFVKHPGYAHALEYVIHRATIMVKSVGQTIVDTAKANGKFDAGTGATAKAAALTGLKSMLSKEALEQLAVEMGMGADQAHKLDDVLSHVIESVVADQKAGAGVPAMSADAIAAAVTAYMRAGGVPAQNVIDGAKTAGEIAGVKAAAAAGSTPEAGAAAAA